MIPYIEKVFSYRDVFITKKAESNTGELFNATVISAVDASKAKKPIQIKKGRDVKKYGGYTNVNNAFACVIQYEHKKGLKYDKFDSKSRRKAEAYSLYNGRKRQMGKC
jgi:hypothetical protein